MKKKKLNKTNNNMVFKPGYFLKNGVISNVSLFNTVLHNKNIQLPIKVRYNLSQLLCGTFLVSGEGRNTKSTVTKYLTNVNLH